MRRISVHDFLDMPLSKRVTLHEYSIDEFDSFGAWCAGVGIEPKLFTVYHNPVRPNTYIVDITFTEEQLTFFVLRFYGEMRCFAGQHLQDNICMYVGPLIASLENK